jgi:hypothetical protein
MTEQIMAENFGGGENGKKMAELLTCIKFDRPLPDWLDSPDKNHSHPVKPDQSESNQIKPNQTTF